MAYSVQRFRQAYDAEWPNITDRHQCPNVEKDFICHPPLGKKRGVGRQRKNRIPSCLERSGKATRQVRCEGCGELGHRRGSWRCALTGTKKRYVCSHPFTCLRCPCIYLLNMLYRKRTKKAQSKAGRKKSKKTTPEAETVATPRTRAATGREAAAAREAARAAEEAAREATREADQEADTTAREAAAAAAREPQAEASSAKRRLDLDPVPLVVAGPLVPLEALTKKMTQRKKLATKVKKS
jgi:hypothetical protein